MALGICAAAVVAWCGFAACASGDVLAFTSFETVPLAVPLTDSSDVIPMGTIFNIRGAGRNEPTTGDGGVTSGEWGFTTNWRNTRRASDNGVPSPLDRDRGPDPFDAIGVTEDTGVNAPNNYLDGSRGYLFNDGDGRLRLDMAPVDTTGTINRFVEFAYWINATSWGVEDVFFVIVSDDDSTFAPLVLDGTKLNRLESPDVTPAIWRSESLMIPDWFGPNISVSLRVENETESENIFVDRLRLVGTIPGPGTPGLVVLGSLAVARRARR